MGPKDVKILQNEMGEDQKNFVIGLVIKYYSIDKKTRDIATDVKIAIENKFGNDWCCIVGDNFGCSLAYVNGSLLYLKYNEASFLIYRSN